MNPIFNIMIPLWPAAILFALLVTLFLPDRHWRRIGAATTDGEIERGTPCLLLWALAALWFLPAYMATPGAAQFDAPTFWPAVHAQLGAQRVLLESVAAPALLAAYGAIGVVWAVVYFFLYARRLGQRYVMERDLWLREEGVDSLDGLTDAQRRRFQEVIDAVRAEMLYRGDFPLRPLQQKRFFVSNVVLWPLTLVSYLLGDLVVDVARSVWFALRNWIHARWAAGMVEYLEDDALCRGYRAQLESEQGGGPKAVTPRFWEWKRPKPLV